ncbi:hypothetical protein XELAEV_18021638mg [Xenopus laevis]|uniref:Uncharacterized protein n=1 Tax=Xenopus laevis TaxID=8355 RepID=A0A974HRT1_XENLA|nr:hypothetical protein XELAEV_18021638mg [Xenopus laevis]
MGRATGHLHLMAEMPPRNDTIAEDMSLIYITEIEKPRVRGLQIQYRERKTLGDGKPALQSLHFNIQKVTDTIQGEGTFRRRESCRAYTLIYRRSQIQYREMEPLGEGNPALQSLHSNIQKVTDTIQGEGTFRRRESCRAYTLIYRGSQIQYRERKP